MSFFKMLLAFSPWLSFLIIARDSLLRLKIGLVVALVLSLIMGLTRMHRGVILWVGLLFFGYATSAVLVFNDLSTVKYMGVMANGALAFAAWFSIAIRKPFTMDYARAHTDPSLWNHPLFIRTNRMLTSVWGVVFTINTLLAWGKMEHVIFSDLTYELISYAFLISTMAFTSWYPNHAKRQHEDSLNASAPI